MKIFKKVNHNPKLALALGYFDGVHLAHQRLILETVKYAKENGIKTAIVTFDKNPASYFTKEKVLNITSNEEKLSQIEALGVDFAYVLDFEEFMHLDGLKYLEDVLVKNFEPRFIATGFNHTFGRSKDGTPKMLREYAKRFNYEYFELPVQKIESCLISSTNIREMIKQGYVKNTNLLLGRSFSLKNNVVSGQKLARKLGYPTANIFWPSNLVTLKYGVYFGYAVVDKTYPALINWGVRPTVTDTEEEVLEAHILNFDQQIYGKILKVGFLSKIRDEQKFSSINDLKEQIEIDIEEARKLARIFS